MNTTRTLNLPDRRFAVEDPPAIPLANVSASPRRVKVEDPPAILLD